LQTFSRVLGSERVLETILRFKGASVSVSHAVAGIGKYGATRVDIFLDETRVGVADFSPLKSEYIYEPLQIPNEGEIIALAQKKNASEKEMTRMCDERDAVELKLKASLESENRAAIRIYVKSIPIPTGYVKELLAPDSTPAAQPPVFNPSPEPPAPPVFIESPEPVPTLVFDNLESAVDRNRLIVLENRADRIDMVLTRIEKQLTEIENERLDIIGLQDELKSLGTKITNLKGEYNVTASNFRIHQQRCYCNHHFPGGFTKRDETPEDVTSAHAPSKP
jgi:hypothetical protein